VPGSYHESPEKERAAARLTDKQHGRFPGFGQDEDGGFKWVRIQTPRAIQIAPTKIAPYQTDPCGILVAARMALTKHTAPAKSQTTPVFHRMVKG